MYTNADLKISLYVPVHIEIIPWKFRILNPSNSRVIYLFIYLFSFYLTLTFPSLQLKPINVN